MMLAAHRDGHVVVTQPAHAWLSGQLARAWGNERFGRFEPWEDVCLAAEQHDVGMTAWDQSPTLDPATGLPATFMQMDLETHLRQWTEGPKRVLVQSPYAALLTSMHGSVLFQRRREDPRVAEFLTARRAFEERLVSTLDVPAAEVARNQRLLWTWDGMSLGLILGWAPWRAERVPAIDGGMLDVRLERDGDVHTLEPWPFASARVTVRVEGRVLRRTFTSVEHLHEALAKASWTKLEYELRPAELLNRRRSSPNS
jgi:hypothetical protein